MKEIWKDIEEYNGMYQVSNLGRVRGVDRYVPNTTKSSRLVTGRLLRDANNGRGYRYVTISFNHKRSNHYVHRLVATAFIPNPDNKGQVNHKDFNKANNAESNLEWVSHRENKIHRVKNRDSSFFCGVKRADCKSERWCSRINIDGKEVHIGTFGSKEEAAIARAEYIINNNLPNKINSNLLKCVGAKKEGYSFTRLDK